MSTQLEVATPNTRELTIASRGRIALIAGFLLGASTQLVFLWTATQFFLFLRFGSQSTKTFSPLLDICLALFFTLPHSVLLLPAVNKWLRQSIPSQLLGCVHCLATCISLLVLFETWTASHASIWQLQGWAEHLMLAGFYGSWIALFYSLYLTGLGYQTGLLPWWCWLRGKKSPTRNFEIVSIFRFMRHPVYLSFLGLIWFTPHMTLDHAVLTIIWTAYIYVGSYLKDQRLERFIGEPYRAYARNVSGFPLIGFGPWGRRSD